LRLEAEGIYDVLRSDSIKHGVAKFISGNRNWFK